jgi:CPA2 family monovalent cation:H+ antiporter-2
MDPHQFLQTLAVILSVAAVTTVLFQRLKQPVVFGYLLAGMIVGPHLPIPLVADIEIVQTLSEAGVILLLFALGLEFSLRKLIRVGPTAGLVAVAQSSIMVFIGYGLGQAFGWTAMESVYAGAVIAISSTTIIAKAFEEQRVTGKFTQLVLGVLIIEDLIAIFLLAILTALSAGAGFSISSLAEIGLRLAIFLALLIGGGLLVVPRLVRAVVRMNRPETTLIASMGICFAAALLALRFGYSVALGAFIAGSLVGESGEERTVERLICPVRDVFAAIFFVAVGMLIDPALVAEHWLPVVLFTLAVIAGKVLAVGVSSFLVGYQLRLSVQAGMSLAQIGEFSFIIAAVGLSSGATRDFLYPIAVTVSAITTLTTPWLIRSADGAAAFVDAKLPRPLQTFVALYGSWMERLKETRGETTHLRTRRLIGLILLDALVIVGIIIGTSIELDRFSTMIENWTGLAPRIARWVVVGAVATLLTPLLVGLMRTTRRLGQSLAILVVPATEHGPDLGAAPRRVLTVTLQLVIVAAVALAIIVATQPFLPPLRSAIVVTVALGVLIVLGVGFWRSATDLLGHARAGAEVIVAALAQQMGVPQPESAAAGGQSMERIRQFLPGMGDPVPLRVPPESAIAGQTLADVNLRGITGATVLAILRGGESVPMPSGGEVISAGDVLAVVGSDDAVEAARALVSRAGRGVDVPDTARIEFPEGERSAVEVEPSH